MKTVIITGGHFTEGKDSNGRDKQGNFVAYLNDGEEVFILKNRMDRIGITKENIKDVKWPLYGRLGKRSVGTRDEQGNLTNITVERDEIKSVFLTDDELVAVTTAGETIRVKEAVKRNEIRRASELTDEQLKVLMDASW
jgi:hypothetical protein